MKTICCTVLTTVYLLCVSSCTEDKKAFAATTSFDLGSPHFKIDSMLFSHSAKVALEFAMQGSQIRYTTDGTEVTDSSKLYSAPFVQKKSATIKARNYHPDYKPSKQVEITTHKIVYILKDADIIINPLPSPNYAAAGPNSLIDLQKGSLQFRANKHWLGFQEKQIEISITFPDFLDITRINLSTLVDHNAWIFSPTKILVYEGDTQIGAIDVLDAEIKQPANLKNIKIDVHPKKYKELRLVVFSLNNIPAWHQGSGTPAWVFIDELIIE
jgi:hypothetical protein